MPRPRSPIRRRSRSPMRRWSTVPRSGKRDKFEMDVGFAPPKWNLEELPKIRKCFYVEHPISTARSSQEIEAYRMQHKMTLSGTDIPRPVFSFAELSLPDGIMSTIIRNNWQYPTPIQSQGLPMGLAGRDVVGIAQTGSGKTASFVIPAIVHILAQPRLLRGDGPICLILVPTRELAQQVLAVAQDFTAAAGMRTMCFYGGSSRAPQLRELQRGAEVCIATPGRLIDFMRSERKLLSRVTYLVLDEADRMLDMGFEPQIRKVISHIRPDRQTLMWSATWPREVQTLARDFLMNYIQVNIGSVSLHANPNITQIVEVMDEFRKEQRVIELLTMFGNARCLVFTETKRKTDQISHTLRRRGFAVGAMHGDKQQRDREMTLANFRDGRITVLVATDVASRGLDIDDIQFVINYDFPNQTEDYIHRIGRTARSDKKGTAFTFFTNKNAKQAKDLVEILEEAHQEVNPELLTMPGFPARRDAYKRKGTQRFGPQSSNRFGGTQHASGMPGSSFRGAEQGSVNVGGPLGGQNGSGIHPGSQLSVQSNAYNAPFNAGTGNIPPYSVPRGPSQSNVPTAAANFTLPQQAPPNSSTFKPNPNMYEKPAPPPVSSRWDRRTNDKHQIQSNQPSFPPSDSWPGSMHAKGSHQWGDNDGASFAPQEPQFQQVGANHMLVRPPHMEQHSNFPVDGQSVAILGAALHTQGSASNLHADLPQGAFPSGWTGYLQPQAFPLNNQPGGWSQPYY